MTEKPAHNQTPRHFKDALLLFSVPIGIIFVLLAFIYIPRLLANPVYDFVYCEGYYCDGNFSVNPSGKLQSAPDTDTRNSYRNDASLFYYDVKRDATRRIQIDEAARYQLDASSKSPDGYTLKYNSGDGGLLFMGGSKRSWSLTKGLASKPVIFNSTYGESKFIGWILK